MKLIFVARNALRYLTISADGTVVRTMGAPRAIERLDPVAVDGVEGADHDPVVQEVLDRGASLRNSGFEQ